MGAIAELTKEGKAYNDGFDSIVIRRVGGCIVGGRTLDLTGFTDSVVKAGHIIIREKSTNTFKPLGVSSGAYATLPTGCEYAGVLRASVDADAPFAAIMYDGEVNDECLPYPLTDALRTALKSAFPSLYFMHD